jgi:hypothetical protein
MNETKQAKYILGHSQQQIGRLMLQANTLSRSHIECLAQVCAWARI